MSKKPVERGTVAIPSQISRRSFLEKGGAAAGAAALLYVTPSFTSIAANAAYAATTNPCPSVIDFEEFRAGTVITNQIPNIYVETEHTYGHVAMIFDTNNPTGGDTDLKTPTSSAPENLGKVLIISEDNDSHDPDDRAGGGTIVFKFLTPVSISTVKLLDIETYEYIRIKTWSTENRSWGSQLSNTGYLWGSGNNTIKNVAVNSLSGHVRRMEVKLSGSGAVAEIACPRS